MEVTKECPIEETLPIDEDIGLSHKSALLIVQKQLSQLIKQDCLLSDLPAEVTVEEVNSQIALEYGQAMAVYVRRADGEVLPVVVTQNAKVIDLKKALKRHVTLKLQRQKNFACVSWRYIWKTYWLYFEGQKLSEDQKLLKDYGISNKDEVTFIKKLRIR